ncbi:hypothetical protein [Methylobacillus flagellatus]|uniref:Sarcosine oxidase, gamma subunit n=1 Tax=Methylobacillus flagellatus (strain ATCC 51484 / DSM 6875 / VKM B-1610 / KT) TaxID=265072 RepID=Q1H462_METFK|nr:hypothetical protein [Methylobacillus flagellatus]ABE48725.1 hypothetical protein Mfla_0455 [Methylobacillus flagellatus KT]
MNKMQTEKLITPFAHALQHEHGVWGLIDQMKAVTHFLDEELERDRIRNLGIADASFLRKFGAKGTYAAQWLEAQGVVIPTRPNSWAQAADGSLALRLGNSEFLIEDVPGGTSCDRLAQACAGARGVYPVPHVEASFVISGHAVQALFSEVCSIDLTHASLGAQDVVMTQFAGVSVVLIRQDLKEEESLYRLWCDSSYGSYLWEVIAGIAHEHKGGPVGIGRYFASCP